MTDATRVGARGAGRRSSRAGVPTRSAAVALVAAAVGACLEPLEDDAFGYSARILPPGGQLEPAAADTGLVRRVDDADQVPPDVIPRRRGFADGEEVGYWDLGVWPGVAVPVWILRRCGADGAPLEGPAGEVDHLPIVDSVPGSFDYTPFRIVQTVCVTDVYAGERLPSLEALADARVLGLVEEPVRTTDVVSFAVVSPGAALELGGGAPPAAPRAAYYRGQAVAYHRPGAALSPLALPPPGNFVFPARVYEPVTAEGIPLPPVFAVPRTRDGRAAAPGYTGLWLVVAVRLAPGVDPADVTAEAALFDTAGGALAPTPRVAAFEVAPPTATVAREIQAAEGAP